MQMNDDMQMFKKGFNGDAPVSEESNEMAADAAKTVEPEVVIAVAKPEGEEGADEPAETGTDPGAEELPAGDLLAGETAETAAPAEAEMTPEEKHREAAWAGRLRKREEELRMREQALAARESGQGAQEQVHPSDAPAELFADGGEVTDQPAEGDDAFNADDPNQAAERLSADFGDDFVRMIRAVASASVGELDQRFTERFSGLESGLSGIKSGLDDLAADREEDHYERIAEAHPDYESIPTTDSFPAWIQSLDEPERGRVEDILANGRTSAVIKVINQYKDWAKDQQAEQPTNDAIDEAALKTAAGVRSNTVVPPVGENQSSDPLEAFRRGFRNAAR